MPNRLKKHRGSKPLAIAFVSAVGLHWLGLTALGYFLPDPKIQTTVDAKKAQTELLVPLLSSEARKKMIQPRAQRLKTRIAKNKKPKKPRVKRPKPPPRPRGQVVEIPPPADQRRPQQAKLLAAFNSRVKKQQVSSNNASPTPRMLKSDRRIISSGMDAAGSRTGQRRPPKGAKSQGKPKTEKRIRRPRTVTKKNNARKSTRRQVARRKKSTKRLGTLLPAGEGRFKPPVNTESPKTQTEPTDTPPTMAGGPENWRTLLPTMGPKTMAQKDGSIDHLPDVNKGKQTFLNTREYKHSWFFNRVKRSVRQRWRAAETHRRHDPYGRVFGVRDRLTVVHVTLTQQGDLESINVEKDSGVAMLDEAAIQAFQSAQPFPNPPSDLRDGDGRIRFKFGFFLEISGSGFRVFRPY